VGDNKLLSGMEMYIVSSLQFLQDELNRIILDSLLEFIRKSASTFQRGTDDWARGMRANEILTAALVRGVNVPNHEITFQSSSNQLQQSCAGQSHVCALKHLMQRVLVRLSACVSVDSHLIDFYLTISTLCKCSLQIMSLMCTNNLFGPNNLSGTPGKKRTSFGKDMQQHPPILVIFIDLEAFNPRVLQDFIICRGGENRYVEQFPLMFVFGITTSRRTIQHMLPQSISFLLCIELFQSLSFTLHLTTVMDKPINLHMYSTVLCVLLSRLCLKLALLEHFHSQPLSVLCCKRAAALGHATELSHRDVERIQQLPSFMSDDHVKVNIECSWHQLSRLFHICLDFQIRELHISCLEKNVWENEEHVSAMQLSTNIALRNLFQSSIQVAMYMISSTLSDVAGAAEEIISSPRKGLQKKTDLFQLQKVTCSVMEKTDFNTLLICTVVPLPESQCVCYYSSSAVMRPHLNATPSRLPSAVSELGFVKSTKQKSDHVS
uniref:Origin recognition complex, subunit 3 n=1 Tax=Oncorhynchus tshawytscha TaxID=74940 RepID=A0A8C8LW54_ONCTS